VNVSDAGMNGDIGKALTAAALRGKIIYILPGAYTAKTAATISAVGVQVIGIGTPTIEVPTTNTSSVAVLNIESLNGVCVTGLSISWSAFVASQIMVNCSPATGTVQVATEIVGNTFTANNQAATGFVGGTNEMVAINVEDGSEVLVADNRFYPSLGLTCIKATDGYGTVVKDNVISNVTNTFFPDITDLQRRPMWRGIHMQDETGFTLDSNKIRNCGMLAFGAAYEIDSAIYVDNADQTIIEKNNLIAVGLSPGFAGKEIELTANAKYTVIRPDNFVTTQILNPRTRTAFRAEVLDNGVGTAGVLKTLATANGWTGGTFFKDAGGIVHFWETLSGGTLTAGTLIGTLPVGFRPPGTTLRYMNGGSSGGTGSVTIDPTNGEIKVSTMPAGSKFVPPPFPAATTATA